jgi:hypothetical protein
LREQESLYIGRCEEDLSKIDEKGSENLNTMDLELLGATSDLRDSKKKKLKATVVQTNLDLEAYAANYTGEARRV